MGIYDREYYRHDGPNFLASFTERGKVCKWLILANVVCFVIQLLTLRSALPPGIDPDMLPIRVPRVSWFTEWFLLDVDQVLHGQVWRLLTCAFLHDERNLLHILFNMLILWWFGSDVEDLYGPREFLAIYLTAAVASSLAFVLGSLAGLNGTRALGASGAVIAVLVLCALHFPKRIVLLFFFLPVPIWLVVVFLVAQNLFGLLGGGGMDVAFSGHLGGVAFALLYYKLHIRLLSLLPDLRGWFRQRTRPRLRVYRAEEEVPAPVSVPAAPDVDEQLEAKVDAVLEKVARHGKESLTDSERQLLLRASEIYKRRRS